MTDELQAVAEGLRALAQDLGPLTHTEHAPLWLVLDQGGHASRAIVFDSLGRQVAEAFAPITTHRLSGDRVEHDAVEIVQSLRTALDDVAQALGADVDRVQAAGLATQRSSIVCWHAHTGLPLSPVLSWQDRRNAALIAQLQMHRDEIQALTGLVLSPHYGASKLRWCLEHLDAVQLAHQQGQLRYGPLSSYLLHALLQEQPHVVDPANASRTQLWSPATRRWSKPLLEWFGVPETCLPVPVPTLHLYGHLLLGSRSIPLLACTGDQAAVPYANGPLDLHCAYLNLGTGAFALAPLPDELTDVSTGELSDELAHAAPLLCSVLSSSEQQVTYALEGTVNGAASALHWLAERSALDVQRASLALQREQLVNRAVPIFINGIGGIGSPFWLPQVESHFVFDTDYATQQADELAQLAAVLESIAFLLQANVQLLQQRLPTLLRMVAGGGLASCSYLCQCLADLTLLPLTRLGERELTAKGLAYLVAGQPQQWQRDANTTVFTPHSNPPLLARQARWLEQMTLLP